MTFIDSALVIEVLELPDPSKGKKAPGWQGRGLERRRLRVCSKSEGISTFGGHGIDQAVGKWRQKDGALFEEQSSPD